VDDPEGGGKKRREIEIDELEIQKGLLQVGKGLEFLHESAGLVHGNLTPDAIFVNAKVWRIYDTFMASMLTRLRATGKSLVSDSQERARHFKAQHLLRQLHFQRS